MNYDWPGNVRELRNAIERAVVMGDGEEIRPQDLPIGRIHSEAAAVKTGMSLEQAVHDFKRDFIVNNLRATKGNRSLAAREMGIQRTYLSRLIKKYEIREI